MSDANVVPLSHVPSTNPKNGQALSVTINGQAAFIDVVTGDTYDNQGNPTGRWLQKEEDKQACQALSMYVSDQNSRLIGHNILTCGHHARQETIRDQAKSVIALSCANEEQRAQMLDIGVSDVHIPSADPSFISGYTNEGGVADIYSPALLKAKNRDYYYQYDRKDAFQRAIPIAGGAGSAYPEVEPRFGNTLYTTVSRAVGGFVPSEVEGNQDAPLRLQQATLRRMLNAAVLERELRVAALARTSGNWASATTIASGSQWNGGASSDPIKDIQNAIETSAGRPNGIIIPEKTWNAMRRNPAVRSYYGYKSDTPGIPDTGKLIALLELPPIYVARMKYYDASGVLQYVWGNDVVVFRAPTQIPPMDQGDTASSYTFRWIGAGATVQDVSAADAPGKGFVVRRFYNQYRGALGGTQMVLFHSDAEKQTGAYIGNLLINAYQ